MKDDWRNLSRHAREKYLSLTNDADRLRYLRHLMRELTAQWLGDESRGIPSMREVYLDANLEDAVRQIVNREVYRFEKHIAGVGSALTDGDIKSSAVGLLAVDRGPKKRQVVAPIAFPFHLAHMLEWGEVGTFRHVTRYLDHILEFTASVQKAAGDAVDTMKDAGEDVAETLENVVDGMSDLARKSSKAAWLRVGVLLGGSATIGWMVSRSKKKKPGAKKAV